MLSHRNTCAQGDFAYRHGVVCARVSSALGSPFFCQIRRSMFLIDGESSAAWSQPPPCILCRKTTKVTCTMYAHLIPAYLTPVILVRCDSHPLLTSAKSGMACPRAFTPAQRLSMSIGITSRTVPNSVRVHGSAEMAYLLFVAEFVS